MCQTIGCCRGSRTFACLRCKTTAKGLDAGRDPQDPAKTNKTVHPRCPKCQQPMLNLGLSAAIPRRRKWKRLVRWAEGRS